MDRALIERLAEQADLVWRKSSGEARSAVEAEDFDPTPLLGRFAGLVAEECAKLVEGTANGWADVNSDRWSPHAGVMRAGADECAAAIRAAFATKDGA